MARRRTGGSRQGGMTLLELLLVMGLIGVLMGAGAGLLASVDLGPRAAKGMVQGVIRAAHNSAVARGASARVHIDRNARSIRAEAMEVVGTWHFEGQGEVVRGAFEIDGTNFGAVSVEDGFAGRALAFPRGSRARAEVPLQLYPAFDLSQGFRIELALRLDGGGGGRVLALGEAVGIDVSGEGALACWFAPLVLDSTEHEMKGGRQRFLAPPGSIVPGEWRRIAFQYNRREVTVELDGVRIESTEEVLPDGAPVWKIESPLVIGDSQRGFTGAIDALRLSAVTASETAILPENVEFAADVPKELCFDAGGNLDRSVHREPATVTLVYGDGRTAAIRVGLYGTVE